MILWISYLVVAPRGLIRFRFDVFPQGVTIPSWLYLGFTLHVTLCGVPASGGTASVLPLRWDAISCCRSLPGPCTWCGLQNGDVFSLILPLIDWRTTSPHLPSLSPGLQAERRGRLGARPLVFRREGSQVRAFFPQLSVSACTRTLGVPPASAQRCRWGRSC